MYTRRHLMVALPRTGADAGLISYAAQLARLGAAEAIRFMHVLPTRPGSDFVVDRDRLLAELHGEVTTVFGEAPPHIKIDCDVLPGPLVDCLLSFTVEQNVDLVLVGHQLSNPGRYALARRLAMQAPCSVWMVPDGSPAEFNRILVPVDFSEHSADSMQVATALAALAGHAECLALHVRRLDDQTPHDAQEQEFERFMASVDCQGVRVIPLVEEGRHPAHIIYRTAIEQQVDLIVMATRGRSRSAAILLGSVTEDMILETRLPLLAVKHFGAQRRLLEALLDKAFGK